MSRRDEFWRYYGLWGYSPSRWAAALLALFHAVMAFCALGHWTSYWFAALFVNRAISMITDRYYEQWREEQMQCPAVVPTAERLWGPGAPMERFSAEQGAAWVLSALPIFLQCVHRGWWEEAMFVHRGLMTDTGIITELPAA